MKLSRKYSETFTHFVRAYLVKEKYLEKDYPTPKKEILLNLFSQKYYGVVLPDSTEYGKWIRNEKNIEFYKLMNSIRQTPKIKKPPRVPRVKKEKTPIKLSLWQEKYSSYIKSAEWKKIRRIILERDGFRCTQCTDTKNLEVHHKTYKNVFNEANHLEDLETLCVVCHIKETQKLKQYRYKK